MSARRHFRRPVVRRVRRHRLWLPVPSGTSGSGTSGISGKRLKGPLLQLGEHPLLVADVPEPQDGAKDAGDGDDAHADADAGLGAD